MKKLMKAQTQPAVQSKSQRNTNSQLHHSPQAMLQQKKLQALFGSAIQRVAEDEAVLQGKFVIQAKTDVVEDKGDGTSDETSSKLINTPTLGKAWFRFKKAGNVIDTFANNIYSGTGTKGASPVSRQVELGQAAAQNNIANHKIPTMTRAQHFALGDWAAGINKGNRTGKYTWHHMQDTYKMELVDMYTHGGFFHYGGFSAWQEGIDDNDD